MSKEMPDMGGHETSKTSKKRELLLVYENESKMSEEEWNEALLKIMQQAMEMAVDAKPYSAGGFGGDVRRVETSDWAAAVRIEDGLAVKVEAVWLPETEGDGDPNYWQSWVKLPERPGSQERE